MLHQRSVESPRGQQAGGTVSQVWLRLRTALGRGRPLTVSFKGRVTLTCGLVTCGKTTQSQLLSPCREGGWFCPRWPGLLGSDPGQMEWGGLGCAQNTLIAPNLALLGGSQLPYLRVSVSGTSWVVHPTPSPLCPLKGSW